MSKQMILLSFIISVYAIFSFLASYNDFQIKRTTRCLRKELQGESLFPRRIIFYNLTTDEQKRFKTCTRITDFSAVGWCILFYYSWMEMYLGFVIKALIAFFFSLILYGVILLRHQYITSRIKFERAFIFTDKKEHPLKIRLERKGAVIIQRYHESLRNYSIVGFICINAVILMIWHIRGLF